MEQHEQGPTGGITAHLTIRDNRAADAIDFLRRHSAPRRSAGTWPTTASASCTRISSSTAAR